MNVINIPRDEVIALVQEAVGSIEINAHHAILLKRTVESAPFVAFGTDRLVYNGTNCACPAVRAGLNPNVYGSDADRFASAFDRLVCETYDLQWYDDGVLVIS